MLIRLYLDEDAQDKDLVRALRLRGIDVVTANEAGLRHRDDAQSSKESYQPSAISFI